MSTNIQTPDITLRRYGEAREPAPEHRIAVGPLTFAIQGMALRWICRDGIELLRGLAVVLRDADWGTYTPEVQFQDAGAHDGTRRIILTADIVTEAARLACRISIEASETSLVATAEATAQGDFKTNRTGFVVLHAASCAGQPVRVEHLDGTVTDSVFPKLVSPHQPFFSIRAIEHSPAPGITVRTAFEGDIFEMEDQRNWSDASFKIYSRPLELPYPYVIRDGETIRQTVRVRVIGDESQGAQARRRPDLVEIRVRGPSPQRLPALAVGGRPQEYSAGEPELARLASLRPAMLLAELDAPGADNSDLVGPRAACARTGAPLVLMLRRPREGLTELTNLRLQPSAVALAGADTALIEEARRLFPDARIGAGTDAFFAEFNRKPPVAADFAFWTVNPTVHAEDDASVMETLAVLADQAETARAHRPGIPLWCGSVTLRMRFNPNATGPARPTPRGHPPPDTDARQRGLLGAAFTLGHIAAWTRAGIETLVLHAPFGPRGLIHKPAGFRVPWYDDQPAGTVYPVYHVLAGLAPLSGSPVRNVENSAPEQVAALATEGGLWLANFRPDPVTVSVPGDRVRVLDEESFVEAVTNPDGFWDRSSQPIQGGVVRLGSYAVARVTGEERQERRTS